MIDMRPFAPIILTRRPQRTYRRRAITITNNESSELADFQVEIPFTNPETYGRSFIELLRQGGVRFTGPDGPVPHWAFQHADNIIAYIVKVTLPASASKVIHMHYGGYVENPWSGEDVFWFFDDFLGSAIDTDKWDAEFVEDGSGSGIWTVENSFLKLQPNGPSIGRIVKETLIPSTSTDMIIEAMTKIGTMNGLPDYGLLARFTDTTHIYMWCFCYWDVSYDNIGMAVKNPGWSDLGGVAERTVVDRWCDLRFQLIGTSLKGYVNGILGKDVTNSALTQGRPGLLADDAYGGNGIYWFDNFRVRKATANMPGVSIGAEELVTRRW